MAAISGTGETARELTSTSTKAETEIIHLTDAESRETDAGGDTDPDTETDPAGGFILK